MLEMYMWDNFSPESITPQMRYWVDYWKEKVESFPDYRHGLCLNSPRILFNEILSEIEFNNLRNDKVKGYFKDQVKFWLSRKDIVGPAHLYLILLAEAFKEGRHSYIAEVCRQGLKSFTNDQFFLHLHNALIVLLLKETFDSKDESKLEEITELMIIEFMYRGYSLKSCENIPVRIFDVYHVSVNNIITTKFPHQLDFKNFKIGNDENDYSNYYIAIKELISKLTISERINALKVIYNQSNERLRVIIPVNGVTSSEPFKVGPVEFYTPSEKKFIKQKNLKRDEELFGQVEPIIFSNATLIVEARDKDEAVEKAVNLVEGALDIITFYQNVKEHVSVEQGQYIILNEENESVSWTMGRPRGQKSFLSLQDSIRFENFSSNTLKEIDRIGTSFLIKDINRGHDSQIASVLHWFRKGCEEKRIEDQLVSFWVSLEKMFPDNLNAHHENRTKIESILDLVPSTYVNQARYKAGWKIFYELRQMAGAYQGGRVVLNLPKDLLQKSHLDPDFVGRIHLKNFIDSLDDIEQLVDRKIIRNKISSAKNFFSNNKFAAQHFTEMTKEVYEDILMSYRFRNKIVHDAHFSDRLLPYYVKKLQVYVRTIIAGVINDNSHKTFFETCTKHKVELECLTADLNNDPSLNLLSK